MRAHANVKFVTMPTNRAKHNAACTLCRIRIRARLDTAGAEASGAAYVHTYIRTAYVYVHTCALPHTLIVIHLQQMKKIPARR